MRRKGAMVATFAGAGGSAAQLQKSAKNRIHKKFVKLTDHSYACNILTNFEHHSNAMTGNGYGVNFFKNM